MCVGLTGHQSGYVLESSFGEAWRPKPGAKQTFPLPPGSSERFHPAREPRSGGGAGEEEEEEDGYSGEVFTSSASGFHYPRQGAVSLGAAAQERTILPAGPVSSTSFSPARNIISSRSVPDHLQL